MLTTTGQCLVSLLTIVEAGVEDLLGRTRKKNKEVNKWPGNGQKHRDKAGTLTINNLIVAGYSSATE
jgi:hypothetical protein